MRFSSLLCCLVYAQIASSKHNGHKSVFNEKLKAQSLLGSHFGQVDLGGEFDYVVIGGGTAGLAIARRLADHNTVAVIEAGGFYEFDNGNLTEIPSDASYYLGKDPLFRNPLIDWNQHTTPQAGFKAIRALYPAGHTLGGGSTRNFMWYQRGSRGSYQKWANATGDDGYLFENLLPFFKKSVDFTPLAKGVRTANTTPLYDLDNFSEKGGPLKVSYPKFACPASSYVGRGLESIGVKQTQGGLQDGNLFGWAWIAQCIDPVTQTRTTSETSFLRNGLKKDDNLIVYKNTLAKKILFDDKKCANGVLVESTGVGSGSIQYTLKAKKEVILSAGSFRSPQMLMVSGVGPAHTLKANGIDVLSDLPGVGQNMWDHVFFGPTWDTTVLTHGFLADSAFNADASKEYYTKREGILTNVGSDLLGFEKLPKGTISKTTRDDLDNMFGDDWPDIEILALDAYTGHLDDYLLGAPDAKNYTAMCVSIVAPFSRGNVSISSNDTNDHPIVNPNWLSDPRDQEVAIAGFKRARAVFAAPAVQPILKGQEAFPGPQVKTDAQIREVLQTSSDTIHHAAGTCRMGMKNDTMAVLDSHARVFGVSNLRVVDASTFPLLPPGHPQATVYMLAEKIAHDILAGN